MTKDQACNDRKSDNSPASKVQEAPEIKKQASRTSLKMNIKNLNIDTTMSKSNLKKSVASEMPIKEKNADSSLQLPQNSNTEIDGLNTACALHSNRSASALATDS